jgi:MFS family permease
VTAPERSTLREAWVVWIVGILIYVLAVFHRSSLGVAGLVAAERFGISATQLATFTMLQLLVYAGMQIPVGLMIDRFGPRTVLFTGLVLITLAQAAFAFAEDYTVALLARVVVGIGDAMTFICVLRLVTSWFPARRIPFVTQLTGTLGQLGAVAAAIPMTWALAHLGWTPAYLWAAGIGVVLMVALLFLLGDAPGRRHVRGPQLSLASVRHNLAESWAHPGTRLGFWMHFTSQFSATTMSLLWGYPFFVRGEGRSPATAGLLLTLIVVAIMASGPILGWLVGAHPWHRSTMVLTIVAALVAAWTAVLAWPGNAPLWLLVALVLFAGFGGPASIIGFDVGRTSNPAHRLGAATGIINQGGFYATLFLVVAIGLVLDWRTPGGGSDYPASAFRWAMSVQYLLWTVGVVQIWRYRVRTRALILKQQAEDADLAKFVDGR